MRGSIHRHRACWQVKIRGYDLFGEWVYHIHVGGTRFDSDKKVEKKAIRRLFRLAKSEKRTDDKGYLLPDIISPVLEIETLGFG